MNMYSKGYSILNRTHVGFIYKEDRVNYYSCPVPLFVNRRGERYINNWHVISYLYSLKKQKYKKIVEING